MKKLIVKRKWTFDGLKDQESLFLAASIGIGNREIGRTTGFTRGQISYARRLLKHTMGLEESLYFTWLHGNHPLQKNLLRDYSGVLLAELRRTVVPQLVQPTPITVREKQTKNPTVSDLVRMRTLRKSKVAA